VSSCCPGSTFNPTTTVQVQFRLLHQSPLLLNISNCGLYARLCGRYLLRTGSCVLVISGGLGKSTLCLLDCLLCGGFISFSGCDVCGAGFGRCKSLIVNLGRHFPFIHE